MNLLQQIIEILSNPNMEPGEILLMVVIVVIAVSILLCGRNPRRKLSDI